MAIVIGVRQKDDVGRAGEDETAAGRNKPVDWWEVCGPERGSVHDAVGIGILEHFNDAIGSGFSRLFEFFVGLDASDLGVELAGLIEFLDVQLAFEIVAVEFADEEASASIPADA
ncbi:MAG: hypothetical protein RI897_620 [Verrucomicrobiota bacterium]